MSGLVDDERPKEREAPYVLSVVEVFGLHNIVRPNKPVQGREWWGGVAWGSRVFVSGRGHYGKGSNCDDGSDANISECAILSRSRRDADSPRVQNAGKTIHFHANYPARSRRPTTSRCKSTGATLPRYGSRVQDSVMWL